MKKYAISKEFFPWNLFAPPISEKFLAMSVPHMKPPKRLWRHKELDVTTHEIESYDGGKITCFLLSPKNLIDNKKFEIHTPDVSIKVDPARADLIETRIIGGVKYILIPADEEVEVNGVSIHIGEEEVAGV